MQDPIVIVGAARTPMGAFQGDFAGLAAADLGAVAIRAALERSRRKGDLEAAVIFGDFLTAGRGQATEPARLAGTGTSCIQGASSRQAQPSSWNACACPVRHNCAWPAAVATQQVIQAPQRQLEITTRATKRLKCHSSVFKAKQR